MEKPDGCQPVKLTFHGACDIVGASVAPTKMSFQIDKLGMAEGFLLLHGKSASFKLKQHEPVRRGCTDFNKLLCMAREGQAVHKGMEASAC